ncbi:MAG: hypothetical protein QOH55_2142 [Microbacteriaceae bacterium]|jgi:hypothetical protein|nr:hypothetical protein [Microbacteriaceae bacterium]
MIPQCEALSWTSQWHGLVTRLAKLAITYRAAAVRHATLTRTAC